MPYLSVALTYEDNNTERFVLSRETRIAPNADRDEIVAAAKEFAEGVIGAFERATEKPVSV